MSGTSKSDASLQHDLISAPVQLVSSGREQFAVGMERSGCCRALFRSEGLTDAQPCEGDANGGHCGAESLGGVGRSLRGGVGGGSGLQAGSWCAGWFRVMWWLLWT